MSELGIWENSGGSIWNECGVCGGNLVTHFGAPAPPAPQLSFRTALFPLSISVTEREAARRPTNYLFWTAPALKMDHTTCLSPKKFNHLYLNFIALLFSFFKGENCEVYRATRLEGEKSPVTEFDQSHILIGRKKTRSFYRTFNFHRSC